MQDPDINELMQDPDINDRIPSFHFTKTKREINKMMHFTAIEKPTKPYPEFL